MAAVVCVPVDLSVVDFCFGRFFAAGVQAAFAFVVHSFATLLSPVTAAAVCRLFAAGRLVFPCGAGCFFPGFSG